MGDVDPLDRARDRAVVEEAQVLVAVLAQQLVGLVDVDTAAEQVREDALVVPRRVPFEQRGEAIEQQVDDPLVEHPLRRGQALVVGHPVAGE